MAVDEDKDVLPDRDAAKEFYARYEPKEVLGRGGCSVVRRCIEKETGHEYAAKIIDLSDASDVSVKESTRREVEILRMVAGHSYISRLIMRQLLEALDHVHSKGIVHRDLKPENILLDDSYNVKLTDFGFAKVLRPGEKLSELCGTPGYLAPELLRANMIDGCDGYSQQVDLWACGVIMYTLLVGCPPFWHRKQMIMIRNIMEGKFSFLSPEWEDITDAPKDLISRFLVVDPDRRITVKGALAHEFFQILQWTSGHPFIPTVIEMQYKVQPFNARKKFQFGILCIRALVRISRLKYTPEPISIAATRIDPYRVKNLRKVIDNCAFRVYGHWVKKGEGQDRAALFQNYAKIDHPSPSPETTLTAVMVSA